MFVLDYFFVYRAFSNAEELLKLLDVRLKWAMASGDDSHVQTRAR